MKLLKLVIGGGFGNESGKALVELALVVPLLIGIALPAIDGVNFARAGHLLNTVARESARAAFSCAYIRGLAADISSCIETNIQQALPVSDGVAAAAEITVRVWQHNPAGAVLVSEYKRGNLTSRIPQSRVETLHSYTAEKDRILIVETRFPFNPLSPFFETERYLVTVM